LEESETLRYYRKVIVEKYSDFQARHLDFVPPEVFSLARSVGGVTMGSDYPNLLSVEARLSYGI